MTAAADRPPSVPPQLVQRFAEAFGAFVKAAADAVADAARKPELANTREFAAWQRKVLPLLQEDNESLKRALVQYDGGDIRGVLVAAEDKRGLAKDMDGYPLTFAGPDHAQVLAELRTAVVRGASRLCAEAGIP